MAEKKMTAIIEIGSSAISGAVGFKRVDGTLEVMAYAAEDAGEFVKNGVVRNIDKTAQSITNIINKLEGQLGAVISQVYVGLEGYTLHSTHQRVEREFEEETRVTAELIDQMTEECQNTQSPDKVIIRVIPQEYMVDSMTTTDPVGCNCKRIVGECLNLEARFTVMNNLRASFDMADVEIADDLVTPLLLCEKVLTDNDRNLGCALVDMGAETTTVTIYKGGCLRFLSVIPMGSQLITSDLTTLGISIAEAEEIKRRFGLSVDKSDSSSYTTENGTVLPMKTIALAIRARFQEIISNVLNQLKVSGYADDKLSSGIVFTGGGMEMTGVEAYLQSQPHFPKFRMASFKEDSVEWNVEEKPVKAKRLVLATLLAAGNDDCVTIVERRPVEVDFGRQNEMETLSLFTDTGEDAQAERERKQKEEEEKRRAEEEKKRKEAEEKKKEKPKKKGFFERLRDKAEMLIKEENE